MGPLGRRPFEKLRWDFAFERKASRLCETNPGGTGTEMVKSNRQGGYEGLYIVCASIWTSPMSCLCSKNLQKKHFNDLVGGRMKGISEVFSNKEESTFLRAETT